jgi:hypothetical protein
MTALRLTKPQAYALHLAARPTYRRDRLPGIRHNGTHWLYGDAGTGVQVIRDATMRVLLERCLLTWARAWRLEDCVATLGEAGRDWLRRNA